VPPVRPDALADILPVRQAVLIHGTDRTDPCFEGDDAPTTRHFGAFDTDGRCIGCLTLMREDLDGRPAYRLRGMGIADGHRGGGVGRRLLETAVADTDPQHRFVFWCNARALAVPFYEKLGWRTVDGRFEIPGVGPHERMVLHRRPDA